MFRFRLGHAGLQLPDLLPDDRLGQVRNNFPDNPLDDIPGNGGKQHLELFFVKGGRHRGDRRSRLGSGNRWQLRRSDKCRCRRLCKNRGNRLCKVRLTENGEVEALRLLAAQETAAE